MYPDTERGDEAQEAAGATQGVVRCPPLPSATSAQQHCPTSAAQTDLGNFSNIIYRRFIKIIFLDFLTKPKYKN